MNDTSKTELDAQLDEIERVKARILNEGSLPRRKDLVDELEMLSYKRGFKEAESFVAQREQAAELRGRIDELKHVRMAHYTGVTEIFRDEKAITVKERLTELELQATKPEKEGDK